MDKSYASIRDTASLCKGRVFLCHLSEPYARVVDPYVFFCMGSNPTFTSLLNISHRSASSCHDYRISTKAEGVVNSVGMEKIIDHIKVCITSSENLELFFPLLMFSVLHPVRSEQETPLSPLSQLKQRGVVMNKRLVRHLGMSFDIRIAVALDMYPLYTLTALKSLRKQQKRQVPSEIPHLVLR